MKEKKLLKKDFSKNILDKIKSENIKKTPRCVFVFKHISIWFFLLLSIFVGALSLSISFEYLLSADWELAHRFGVIKIATTFMPIFWICFLLIGTFLSYYNFRHTQRGYKYSFFKILFLNIFLSVILGISFYYLGLNHLVETKIQQILPQYRQFFVKDKISRMIEIWQNEDKGLLLGKIGELGEGSFSFTDYNGKNWNILFDKNTQLKGGTKVEAGKKIKIVGEKLSDNSFKATQIRPFIGKGFRKNN